MGSDGEAMAGGAVRMVVEATVLAEQRAVPVPSGVVLQHNTEHALRLGAPGGGGRVASAAGDDRPDYTLDIEARRRVGAQRDRDVAGGGDLIAGLSSAQTEPNGWNAIVRAQLGSRPNALEVVRTVEDAGGPALLRVRLSAFPEYDILEAETVHITVPGSAPSRSARSRRRRRCRCTRWAAPATSRGRATVCARSIRALTECTIDVQLVADAWRDGLEKLDSVGDELCADCTRWRRSRAGGTRRASE